ncbi:hypothetical protein BTN50_0703 [Candidatus Enterovibrio altilux]|uniref:Mobile element protein n=1 Tax=Candidatus Enterovibrio altilux TaxID=1927128 RepID=A0A291B879_9GAMM|nr:hypothetical protein BTN50_0703 [Candidatus Enterovibrio luxaltus]
MVDGAYDIRQCYETIRIKRAVSFISSKKEQLFKKQSYPCTLAVSYQKLYGFNRH